MDKLRKFVSWRRLWLITAVAYPAALLMLVAGVFPSRADVERAWLNKAIDIEKQFDPSASKLNHAMLRARFAGISDRRAIDRIREDLYKAQPPLNSLRPVTARQFASMPGTVTQHFTGRLLWFDPAHTLTPEALDYLKDEFARVDALFLHRLEMRPRQIMHASIAALSLAGFTLTLLYVFGLLVEWTFAGAHLRTASTSRLHLGQRVDRRLTSLENALDRFGENLKESLGSLWPRNRL